jgi:Holliday junction resolvasome RuvABC endonuclease subunit
VVVLGIDAASSSGWAVIRAPAGPLELVSWGKCNGKDFQSIVEVCQGAVALGVDLAAIETPYVDQSPDVAIKLGLVVGRWAQEIDRHKIPWTGHKAAQWQHRLLAGLIGPSSPRDQRKLAAQRWVRANFAARVGAAPISDDEADAICLAAWRAKESRFAALVRRA